MGQITNEKIDKLVQLNVIILDNLQEFMDICREIAGPHSDMMGHDNYVFDQRHQQYNEIANRILMANENLVIWNLQTR